MHRGDSSPEDRIRILQRSMEMLRESGDILDEVTLETVLELLREKHSSLLNARRKKVRRYVTVVFADVTGFTSICEANDAEYVTKLINTLWSALDSVIIDHGGVIDKHIGDAVMAIWGSEKVRESDASRAVSAALEIQKRAQTLRFPDRKGRIEEFKVRVGVHSGPAFLGSIGLKDEYTAMGDTVNIAARLQSAAPEGAVIVSNDTYRHIRNDFTCEQRDPMTVKGKEESLRTWVVVSESPRIVHETSRGVLGVRTRTVGRESELALLEEVLEAADSDQPSMVTVVGEAGVGKSRLLNEFRDRQSNRDQDTIFFNASCTPEMRNTPCAVFRDILRYRMNVRDDDHIEEVVTKLKLGMGRYLSEDRICIACHYAGFDLSDQAPVKRLMGTPALGGEGRSALVDYFLGIAADTRTLLYLEDLQWADETSLDLIEEIGGSARDCRLLILALARPELLENRPEWGKYLQHRFLHLDPLSESASSELIDEIFPGGIDIPEKVLKLISEMAAGNPFYLEEFISMLIDECVISAGDDSRWSFDEASLKEWNVPSTLNGILQARLDSLPGDEKDLLQKASVIGRMFWDLALRKLFKIKFEEMINRRLISVVSRDLVMRSSGSTFRHSSEYLFKHAILRDVTYETVLLDDRKIYHRNTARWLEESSGERRAEFSGLIAEHYYLGEDWENALVWLIKSATASYSTASFHESRVNFQRALEIVPEDIDDETLASLNLKMGCTLVKLCEYDKAVDHLDRALDLSESRLPALAASALLELTWVAILRGNTARSWELANRAYELAMSSEDKAVQARAIMRMADFEESGEYDQVTSHHRRSLAIYEELQDVTGIAITTLNLGNMAFTFDRLEESEGNYRRSLENWKILGNRWGIANCLGNLGNVELARGNYEESRQLHERSREISKEIGDSEGVVICHLNLGRDEYHLNNRERSYAHLGDALTLALEVGLVPLALGAIHLLSLRFTEDSRWEDAAHALYCIRKNRSSFLPDSRKTDIDAEIESLDSKLEGTARKRIIDFVQSHGIEDTARLLIGKMPGSSG